jgi:uncharacterized protein YjbJ (UPF0337 family)
MWNAHDIASLPTANQSGRRNMDENRIKGRVKKAEGAAKDALGKLTDSPKLQAEGKIKTAEGTVQEAFGRARDAVRKK